MFVHKRQTPFFSFHSSLTSSHNTWVDDGCHKTLLCQFIVIGRFFFGLMFHTLHKDGIQHRKGV